MTTKRKDKHKAIPLHNSNTNSSSNSTRRRGVSIDIHGFTLTQVARGAGLSKSHASHIFSGKRNITLRLAARLAQYLGISLDDLHFELTHCAKIARATGQPIQEVANRRTKGKTKI